MKKNLFLRVLLALAFSAFAKTGIGQVAICGTEMPDSQPMSAFSSEPLKIDVKVYIIRTAAGQNGISDASVTTALQQLNTAFTNNNTNISFTEIESRAFIDDNSLVSISISQASLIWNSARKPFALNIYFVPQTPGLMGLANGVNFGNTLGAPPNPERAQIIIGNNFALDNYTIIHEVGHALGLLHTHVDASVSTGAPVRALELVNGSNCQNAGDFVCDTPAEPFNLGRGINFSVSSSCGYIRPANNFDSRGFNNWNDANGDPYAPDVRNYMGFSISSCVNYFSPGQIARMQASLITPQGRANFLVRANVTAKNTFNGQNIDGSFLTVNGSVVPSNSTQILFNRNNYEGKTNQERFLNFQNNPVIKHLRWSDSPLEFKLKETFTPSVTTTSKNVRDAQFNSASSATVRSELIDAPNFAWGSIEVKDPWYVADATGAQPNAFIPFTSPYALTGAYNQSTGGVFLNQGQDPSNPQPPYYSARAQSSQTIGGYTGDFLGWAGVGATPSAPAALETPVVFTAPNAVVSARYKGRLLSSLANATSAGNQRRLANAQGATLYNNVFYLVYESAGKIWLTYSTDSGILPAC